jgi:hypothetical protein
MPGPDPGIHLIRATMHILKSGAMKKTMKNLRAAISLHPPLEGEGRRESNEVRCKPGWGERPQSSPRPAASRRLGVDPPPPGEGEEIERSYFVNLPRLYSVCRRKPDMAINGRRNKPFGPGGSTRRLHPSPQTAKARHGFRRGRTRIDEGVKGALLPGMVPALSGQNHSCKRQLCSGCSGCVTQSEIPI